MRDDKATVPRAIVRAAQEAVDRGDYARAKELLESVRDRHLRTQEKARRKAARTKHKNDTSRIAAEAVRTINKGKAKATRKQPTKAKISKVVRACRLCRAMFKPWRSNRQTVCSVCEVDGSTSVRTVSGGLPGLGRRK